ncbi:3-hydroxyacyl-ACP dehydratase FabZ family protein [Chengkuizengella sp. SCS-71B]|uniref:3-hydroxyacyl-ACP dehydratase FabZ family protein n=1 Tax=Chengkuizengella sp. SCS-71B TaxID=3115290 RepID=UPI0032C22D1B
MKQLVNMLPQKWPFRFIDHITAYKQKEYIRGTYYISQTTSIIKDHTQTFPASFITEGLAQLAVIFITLETKPLRENEVPLLGSIKMESFQDLPWHLEKVKYEISPIKIFDSQAVLYGVASVENKVICKGELSVAKSIR